MAGYRGASLNQQFESINGSPAYLGTVQSTGTNVIAGSAFTNPVLLGDRLMIQPDADGYFLPSNHSTTPVAPSVTNSSTAGVKVLAGEKVYVLLRDDEQYVQWISASGTTNLKVWRLM